MLFLTAQGGLLKPIATLFGYLMNGIFLLLEKFGIGNIGLAIIIFTFITRLILYPLTIKQQKSSRLMTIIQPEIKAIQDKYVGKTDQQSMMAQQAEMKAVYEKYGTSMTGSCLQMIIQMPIIFALYNVIMNVPAYVPVIKERFMTIIDAMGGTEAVTTIMNYCEKTGIDLKTFVRQIPENFGLNANYSTEAIKNYIIDFLYKLNPNQLANLVNEFPVDAQNIINTETEFINRANSFCGLNLSTAPSAFGIISPYILIPILAALSQYLSVAFMQKTNKRTTNNENDSMQQTMNSMNIMMPIISLVFCYGLAAGVGVYWITTSLFMVLTQLIVNKQLENLDIDEMIKQNVEKANKKRAKKGLPPISTKQATNNIKKMEENYEKRINEREDLLRNQQKHVKEANEYYFGNEENSNSLFAKANMVQKYNEKNNK